MNFFVFHKLNFVCSVCTLRFMKTFQKISVYVLSAAILATLMGWGSMIAGHAHYFV